MISARLSQFPLLRRRALLRGTAAIALMAAAALVCLFPFAGRYLVTEDPLERSDAIVVLAGARVERWLEAVELYRAGWAPRILLSRGRMESAQFKLLEMGIHFPEEADLVRDAMVQMRVPAEAIMFIPGAIDNTAGEAAATRGIAIAAGWQRVIVVTSKYHSRRTRFAFAREFRRIPIRVLVRPSRYDTAMPDRWWAGRGDFRYVTSELQKLLAYRLGLGE